MCKIMRVKYLIRITLIILLSQVIGSYVLLRAINITHSPIFRAYIHSSTCIVHFLRVKLKLFVGRFLAAGSKCKKMRVNCIFLCLPPAWMDIPYIVLKIWQNPISCVHATRTCVYVHASPCVCERVRVCTPRARVGVHASPCVCVEGCMCACASPCKTHKQTWPVKWGTFHPPPPWKEYYAIPKTC